MYRLASQCLCFLSFVLIAALQSRYLYVLCFMAEEMEIQRDPLRNHGSHFQPRAVDSKPYACSMIMLDKRGTAAYIPYDLAMNTSPASSLGSLPLLVWEYS